MPVVEELRRIKCATFWDVLVLRLMFEEHGVRVRMPDEGVVLSREASGVLNEIKAAVAQFRHEFPHSGPVMIEGEARGHGADSGQMTSLTGQTPVIRDHIAAKRIVGPAQSKAASAQVPTRGRHRSG